MRYLLIVMLLFGALSVFAQDSAFSIDSLCKTADEYRVNLAISDEIMGLAIYPSHSATFEVFASGIVSISLDNDWIEIRPMTVEPMRYEMLYFENVADCDDNGQAVAIPREAVMEAVNQAASTLQEGSE